MHWTDPGFLAEIHAWIRSHVDPTGPIEQPHVQWWSTVLRVPTAEGDVWCKAAAPTHAFEPALVERLSEIVPGRVPELVAIDVRRGWMLMRDGGTRMRELITGVEDLRHWEAFLPRYAELQIAAAGSAGALLEIGVPDERLHGLAERVARLLEAEEFLMLEQPDGLTSAERDRLREQLPQVDSMCRELASFGIPETIQHDDLNDGNVFVRDGDYVAFDWGDACVSHPFHSMTVTLRATAFRLDLPPGGPEVHRLLDAYLEPFAAFGDRAELQAAADLAYRTGTLARSLAWHRSLAGLPVEQRAEDLEAVPYGLQKFLERGPIGSWR